MKLTDEHTSSYSHLRDSGAADAKLSTQRLPDGTKPEPRSSYGVSNQTFKIQNQNEHMKRLNIMQEVIILNLVRNHDKLGVFSKGTVLCGGYWLGRSLGDCRPALLKDEILKWLKHKLCHIRGQ